MQEIDTEAYLNKKKIKREYRMIRYHNITEEKKQRLKEYQKNNYKTKNKIIK